MMNGGARSSPSQPPRNGAVNGNGVASAGPQRQTPLTCTGHTRPVVDLDFSGLTQDGYFLLSACKDGKPMLRQGNTGDWVGTFLGHKGAVWCVSINEPASRAITGSADFTARLWNCLNGEELAQFPHDHIVRSCTFSKDAGLIATGCQDKKVRIFDLNSGAKEPVHTFAGHQKTVKKTVWIDNNNLLTASDDKTLRKWDTRIGKEVDCRTFDDVVSDASITDGTLSVVAGKWVFFFEPEYVNNMPFRQYQLPSVLNSAHLHKDKGHFVAGGEDLKVYKYDFKTGKEIESYKGHFGPVHIIRYSPDGALYASGSEDGTIRLWQNNPGESYGLWKGTATSDAKQVVENNSNSNNFM